MRLPSGPRRLLGPLIFALSVAASTGCMSQAPPARDPVLVARQAGADSSDGEVIGKWLLAELVAPGGSREQAVTARKRLDDVARDQKGMYASVGRGLDDEMHGALKKSAGAYLAALEAAHSDGAPETDLVAWYAASRLLFLRANVADLWSTAKAPVEKLISEPGQIGWRARGDLVRFWRFDTRVQQAKERRTIDEDAAKQLGCLKKARFAGPFGRPAPLDAVTAFPAEQPSAWPSRFQGQSSRAEQPHTVVGELGDAVCSLRPVSPFGPGVTYIETFFTLERETDLLLFVKSALNIRVDDVEVLAHDPRSFATWSRTSVALRLAAGRHRVVARLAQPESVISVLGLSGLPIDLTQAEQTSGPAALTPPKILPAPDALAPFAASAGAEWPRGWPTHSEQAKVDANDPVLRFAAAELAHVEGLDDLATVLAEPLVKEPSRATPMALAAAASFIEADPVFTANDARDLALDHRRRAVEKDSRLWYSQLWLSLDAASKQGEKDQLVPLGQLALDFPEVPAIGRALASLYAKLGYRAEQKRTIIDLAKRFPNDVELLRSLVTVHDEEGNRAEADKVAARVATLDPSSTLDIERLVARGDLAGAAKLVETRAEGAVGQVKRQALRRITDLLVRAGERKETLLTLELALQNEPSTRATLELADARLASGDHAALRRALAESIRQGSETAELRDAIETVDGVSELEPFRLSAKAAIAEFESSGAAKAGLAKKKGGTAARVLDYATVWVHEDGSGRMLEHEILHMQSNEAIAEHAEQKLPRGKLLRIRTIKANGQTFEPEIVADKPTATMPHLDVGDYIETETLYDIPSDGRGGKSFMGPRWFFREEKIDYHRSEYVIVSPKSRPLVIETTGAVPPPEKTESGPFVIHRWRVDKSPALPNERFGAPVSEFLPSVRAGWGISQDVMLSLMLDQSTRLTPRDPRLVRIAKTIATVGARPDEQDSELAKTAPIERAKRIYRWVLDNVETGREGDPRKAIVGKSGNRLEAFLYLVRLAGVDARHAMVQDRLRPSAIGPISEAELFTEVAVAIPDAKGGEVWTVVDDKYAPFGYMPSSMRGQPAVILRPDLPRVKTGSSGPPDGVSHTGKVTLNADGSGKLSIKQSYSGRLAILLREQVQKIADDERLKVAIESQLLPEGLPGARVISVTVKNLEDLDAPLELELELEVTALARRDGAVLVMAPPFASGVRLSALAALDKRETPLMLPPALALRLEVKLSVELPKGAKLEGTLSPLTGDNDGRSYKVADRVEGSSVLLERVIDIPAGRVQPSDYAAFVKFARAADEAFHRDLTVRLP